MKRTLLGFFILLFAVSFGYSQNFVGEDFESGAIPGDWSQQTNATDGGWLVGTAATLASQYWGIPENGTTFIATNDDACNCDKSSDILVLPSIDVSGATKVFLSFDMIFAGGTYGGATEVATIEASYDGGTTWQTVAPVQGTGTLAWTPNLIDISSVAGNADVKIGFKYADNGGWLFGWALDNVSVDVPPAYDIKLEVAAPYRFIPVGDQITISGIVENLGSEPLNSFEFTWSDGSGDNIDVVSGLNVISLGVDTFEHTVPFTAANPDDVNIDISVRNPNGNADPNDGNNSASFGVTGVMDPPFKKFFIEEATGTWCPWCPRGDVFMEIMEENHPETFVGVAVHWGQNTWPDPMENMAYADEFVQLVGGFPTIQLDRVFNLGIPGPPTGTIQDMADFGVTLEEFSNERASPLGIEIAASVDGPSRTLTADVDVTFHSNMSGTDFGVAVIVTEDNVTGDATIYRQANNYAGGSQGVLNGYELLPNPISGDDISYQNTLREALGGFYGMTGIIPTDVGVGQTYSNTFTYTVPADYDINELSAAVIVVDRTNGAVYNSTIQRGITVTTSVKDQLLDENVVKVYPNPFSDQATIEISLVESSEVTVEVIDAMGKSVAYKNYGTLNGKVNLPLLSGDLNNGIYFVQVQVNDKISTKKVTIAR